MSTSILAPRIDSAFLRTPAGEKLNLVLRNGNWLPGYGHMEYLFSDMMPYWPGDYVFGLARTPGVYDMSWHGGESGLFLTRSFAKVIVHPGKERNHHLGSMKNPYHSFLQHRFYLPHVAIQTVFAISPGQIHISYPFLPISLSRR